LADSKISALVDEPAPAQDALVVIVNDPAGSPVNRKSTLRHLYDSFVSWLDSVGLAAIRIIGGSTPSTPAAGELKLFVDASGNLSVVDANGDVTKIVPLGLTAGRVPFRGAARILDDDAELNWDDTQKALIVGTGTPVSKFQVNGNARFGFGLPVSYQTTISIIGGISAGDTTIAVVSTTGFPTMGVVKCQGELITYTGKTGTSFTGCVRGRFNTTAATLLLSWLRRLASVE
jgi:hypothetical protein